MNNEGIGLGLMIVKQIVQQYNGTINVFSDGEGKGSYTPYRGFVGAEHSSVASSNYKYGRIVLEK